MRIPLDMKRLASLLAAEVSRRRLQIIVIALPYKRRPCRMAHPQQHSMAMRASCLKNCAVSVIIHPLSPLRELPGILRLSEIAFDQLIECISALGRRYSRPVAERIVMEAVCIVRMLYSIDRLNILFSKGTHEVFIIHHIRHAPLAMELIKAIESIVSFRRHGAVSTTSADNAVCRI